MKNKKLLILLLAVCAVFALALTVNAEPTGYEVYVGSTQITSANMNDVFGDGTVSFTPADGNEPAKLYLTGARITTYSDHFTKDAYIYAGQDLDIILSGNNVLGHGLDSGTANWGILLADWRGGFYDLSITSYDDGSLKIYDNTQGIEAADIVIDIGDGNLAIDENGNEAVSCCLAPEVTDVSPDSAVVLHSGNLDLRSFSSMCVKGRMVINGGTVTACSKDKAAFSQAPEFSNQSRSIYYYPIITAGNDPQSATREEVKYEQLFTGNRYVQIERAYRTIVGGEYITKANKDDVFGDGKVKYVPATVYEKAKLYIGDTTITGCLGYHESCSTIAAYEDLDIILTGDVTLGRQVDYSVACSSNRYKEVPNTYSATYGINATEYDALPFDTYDTEYYDITISGTGDLVIYDLVIGIMAKSIDINLDGAIRVWEYGEQHLACCLKTFDFTPGITLNRGTLDLNSRTSNAIHGKFTMNGGTVSATVNDDEYCGNYAFDRDPYFGKACYDNAWPYAYIGNDFFDSVYYPDADTAEGYTTNYHVTLGVAYKQGFHVIGGDTYLFTEDEGMVTSGYINYNGKYYYFNERGIMQTGWKQVYDEWIYFDKAAGGAAANGWKQISGKWYYFDGYGVMQTGWITENNTAYYLAPSGAMVSGWNKIDGKWYLFTASGKLLKGWQNDGGKWYYLGTDGAMVTGWKQLSGKWYYMNSSGVMQTGWVKSGTKWYYMNSNGVMQTGWQKISGKWYYLDGSGAMVTGWQKIGNKWYYFTSSGVMQTGWQKFSGKWYFFESSGAMKTGWYKESGKWYYFKSSGAMACSEKVTVSGKSYSFNASGVCTNP